MAVPVPNTPIAVAAAKKLIEPELVKVAAPADPAPPVAAALWSIRLSLKLANAQAEP